ncbi:MAG: alpha-N-acetylglucosaminidase C-terminal domain-containing protein, partial [Clostridiales bacterium]|nr:alpha-N-acetylglucosaminidase C-terminal domain-containing protein [Clostridiales bacterium]
ILDLWGESDPRFNETNEFDQTPWIWCIINNFGGKQGLFGNLKNILNSTALLASDKTLRYCQGIGMAPEGIGTNPIIYQALLDRIWETDAISEEDWIKTYLTRRYGQLTSNSSKAWKLLLHGIYNCQIKQQGACESIICARPHRNIKNVTTWGPDTYYYDFNEVKEALKLLIKDYNELKNYDGYLYDLVDIARQVIADKARLCYSDLQQDFHNSALQEDFLNLIKVQDALLSTREEFLLGNWLELAKAKATTSQEKEWLEFNARRLITLWGNEEGSKLLRDYACREWAGLTLDFYYKRWQTYFHALSRGTENLIDWYALEDAWTRELSLFTTKPEGDIQHIIHTYILTE